MSLKLRRFIGRKVGRVRSSFPYVSGDEYLLKSDLVLDSELSTQALAELDKLPKNIFVTGKFAINSPSVVASLGNGSNRLTIHNYDLIPDAETIRFIADNFSLVGCVNWLGNHHKVVPLPIGIENGRLWQNGIVKDINKDRNLSKQTQKDIDFLFCFSVSTNSKERLDALSNASLLNNSLVVSSPISPKEYRQLLSRSKYVVSPPGNGPDCHRTWEALYFSCIPVVKKQYWPFDNLGDHVLIVDEWQALLDVNVDDFQALPDLTFSLYERFITNYFMP